MQTYWYRLLMVLILAVAGPSVSLAADPWPSRPIRIVVPYPPGGSDAYARLIAAAISEKLKQPVLIENKPGAGGNTGAESVARSAPDGYTLLFAPSGVFAINPTLYPNIPFDVTRDFTPIAVLGLLPLVAVVHPSVPARTMSELTAHIRANVGKINFGSAGVGTIQHLAGEKFSRDIGTNMVHVPYRGAAPAMTDLLAGHIPMIFEAVTNASSHIKEGKLIGLATTGGKRSSILPNLPTMIESGYPGFEMVSWFAFVAPAGTPVGVINRLNEEINRAAKSAEVLPKLQQAGIEVEDLKPSAAAAFIRAEADRYSAMVRSLQITLK